MHRHVVRRADGVLEIRVTRRSFAPRDLGPRVRGCSVLGLVTACAACTLLGPGLFLALAGFVVTAALTGFQLVAALRAEPDAVVVRHPRAR